MTYPFASGTLSVGETRHMKALLQAQQVNKSDRNDARGIAQMMRVNDNQPTRWFLA